MRKKIAYATDMHSDFNAMHSFLQFCRQENPDLVIASGDLIDRLFDKPTEIHQYIMLQEALLNDQINEEHEAYQSFMAEGMTNVSRLYSDLKSLFESSELPIVSIPGNCDWAGCLNSLKGFDIHGELVDKNGFKILGYGSGSEVPILIPSNYTLSYDIPLELIKKLKQEKVLDSNKTNKPVITHEHSISVSNIPPEYYQSEGFVAAKALYDFKPDIFVSHKPVYEIGDQIMNGNRIGSIPLRIIAQETQPMLITSGHVHENTDAKYIGKTLVINPGNLGRWGETGGYFSMLHADEGEIKEFTIYQFDETYEKIIRSQSFDKSNVISLENIAIKQ